jgi:alpha-tubulin suppressor-like RCC1 family protein
LSFSQISGSGGGGGSVDLTAITTDIIPDTNALRDLGATLFRFRNLYLSGNLISFGNGLQLDTFDWSYLASYVVPPREAASQEEDPITIFSGSGVGFSGYVQGGLLYTFGNNEYGQLGHGDNLNRSVPTQVAGLTGVESIVCGENFSIILMADGTVRSCGLNDNGQLGLGDTTTRNSFTQISGISTAIQVACGYNFALVLLTDGSVLGFGSDANGQLGLQSSNLPINHTPVNMIVPAGPDLVRFIECGAYHSVVLLENGASYVCGDNTYGQLSQDPTIIFSSNTLGVVPGISNVVSAACGHFHTILITYVGNVVSFGRNQGGQLGVGTKTAYEYLPTVIIDQGPTGDLGLSTLAAAGFQHSGVIKGDNSIVMFGNNELGQLGLGALVTEALSPTSLNGYSGYAISAGRDHTVIRTFPENLTFTGITDTLIVGFGDNEFGQVGDNNDNTVIRYFPNIIHSSKFLKKIFTGNTTYILETDGALSSSGSNTNGIAGYPVSGTSNVMKAISFFENRILDIGEKSTSHKLFLDSLNNIYSVGSNTRGQLGNESIINSSTIVDISGNGSLSDRGTKIIQVSTGESFCMALDSSGQVHAWGRGASGRLGNDTSTNQLIPVNISSFGSLLGRTIVQVECSDSSVVALDTIGEVHCWGTGSSGQIGNGSTTTTNDLPINISSFGSLSGRTIIQVSAGIAHIAVLDSTGQVHCWGLGSNGQIGNNTTTSINSLPINVSSFGSLSTKTVKQVICGGSHTLALDTSNVVHAWGLNGNGQLGNNSTTQSLIPIAINSFGSLSGRTVIQLAGGYSHSLALDTLGELHAWGSNTSGRLGNGTTTQSLVPINISSFGTLAGVSVSSIDAGDVHSLAVDTNGGLHAWGGDNYGALGNGASSTSNVPILISGNFGSLISRTVKQVSGSLYNTIAIDDLDEVHVWGYGTFGTIGNNTTTSTNDSPISISAFGSLVFPVISPIKREIVSVSTGTSTSYILDNTGEVHVFGEGTSGKLGYFPLNKNNGSYTSIPVNISNFGSLSGKSIVQISSLGSHVIVLDSSGQVHIWGIGSNGRLGNNDTVNQQVPINISSFGSLSGRTIIQVAVGSFHTLALDTLGQVHCWGNGSFGQIGDGNNNSTNSLPINVSSFGSLSGRTIVQISAGTNHSIVLDSTGQVHCWGQGTSGQLGNNGLVDSNVPVNISSFGSLVGKIVSRISAGVNNSAAIDSGGRAHVWGAGSNGQLSTGNTSNSLVPILITLDTRNTHTPVLSKGIGGHKLLVNALNDGDLTKLRAGGLNSNRQLGNNSTVSRRVVLDITTFANNIVSIANSNHHSACVLSDGTLYTWGRNDYNQCGFDTSGADVGVPTLVPGINLAVKVSCGDDFTIVALSDYTVLSVGRNNIGQLGLGDLTDRSVFTLTSLSSILQIFSSARMTFAVNNIGEVYSWGDNTYGQLGVNSVNAYESTPIKVPLEDINNEVITNVGLGDNHSIIVGQYGETFSAGLNLSGQLGRIENYNTSNVNNKFIKVQLLDEDPRNIVDVSCGNNHSVFLFSNNVTGFCGDNTNKQSPSVTADTWQISLFRNYFDIVAVNCGTNVTYMEQEGQAGAKGIGSQVLTLGNKRSFSFDKGMTVTTNDSNTFILDIGQISSSVYAIGVASSGQLGNGTTTPNITSFQNIASFGSLSARQIIQIASGSSHTVALDTLGQVHCWGNGSFGQIGNNTATSTNSLPVSVNSFGSLNGSPQVIQVAAGTFHTVALDSSGQVHSWGRNDNGSLGVTTTTQSNIPVNTSNFGSLVGKKIIKITCGSSNTYALDSVGGLHAWGLGSSGRIGGGTTTVTNSTPINISSFGSLSGRTIVDIGGGEAHCIALDSAGQVHCWGLGSNGQIGNNTTTSINSLPINVSSFGSLSGRTIVQVNCGQRFTIALDTLGDVHCWGEGDQGQIGNNTTTSINPLPINISSFGSLSGVPIYSIGNISQASDTVIVRDTTGRVHGWGDTAQHQLNTGSTANVLVPVLITDTVAPESTIPVFQNFTGQHRCFIEDLEPSSPLSFYEGLTVSSNKGKYKTLTDNNIISINESLPVVSLSDKPCDKSVFGVISLKVDQKGITNKELDIVKELGDTRIEVNSIGEGAIWVTDLNGNIEAGDYLTTCVLPGYTCKQDDDILRNYTVAKATMDCNFSEIKIPCTRVKKDTYGNNILDPEGAVIHEIINGETRNFYDIRYLRISPNFEIISKEEYENSNGADICRAAFIGCTYHCG